MKYVVSVSLGSDRRDKIVETTLGGERIRIERIGTNGDVQRATQLYRQLDKRVDAFGVGGTDLGFQIEERYYPIYETQRMVQGLQSPVVDGSGIRRLLDRNLMQELEEVIAPHLPVRRAIVTSAIDRYDLAKSLTEADYDVVFCDLMFGLGLPIPVRGLANLRRLAALLLPILGRLPIRMLYPTGERQQINRPKYEHWYRWAAVVAGDFNYIRRHMPLDMHGKIVVTNSTTPEDVELCRERGASHLITVTPRFEGRSFGTNVIEAALIALTGKGRPLEPCELEAAIRRFSIAPAVHRLN